MIDRRILMQLMGAAWLSACSNGDNQAASRMKIVVVGAGIVGASIAYHLSKLGVAVTIIDKYGPATQTSKGTFAWINATWAKQPRSYHGLNQEGVSGWLGLQRDLNLPIKWGGSLEWFDGTERQKRLKTQIDEQIEWGEDARMVTGKTLGELEPHIDFTNVSSAAYSGNDGAVDPVLATLALLKGAQAHGAVIKYPCELLDMSFVSGQLQSVETNLGTIAADKVILATGAAPDMAERFAQTPLPQRSTPGVIVITKPLPPLLNRIVSAPGVHMHQRLDGRIVLGEQSGAPDNDAHMMRLKRRPITFPMPELAEQHFSRILTIAKKFVPKIGTATLESAHIGWRPLPVDGHPVLGFSPSRPDVYLAVMHSGVSLAPIVGQVVAQEVTTANQNPQLAQYRPDRIFKRVKRY
ncbi:MAG: FAD-binding oxidoreductase [Robiginitomaculum sp.]